MPFRVPVQHAEGPGVKLQNKVILLGKSGWAETAEDCMLGTRQRGSHSVKCCGITMMPSPPATIRSCLESIKKQKQNDTILLSFPAVVYYGRVQRAE